MATSKPKTQLEFEDHKLSGKEKAVMFYEGVDKLKIRGRRSLSAQPFGISKCKRIVSRQKDEGKFFFYDYFML